MKVSIVIPAYNAEKYLDRCIRSVLEQTYQELELILIDDGSEDETGNIGDRFAASDSRIRVFHQENRGVIAARMEGLKRCSGDYIMFVDSDDYLQESIIGIFVSYIQRYNADMVCCNYSVDGKTVTSITEVEEVDKSAVIREIMIKKKIDGNLWAKIYRQELIKEVHFSTGLYDDFLVVADIAEHAGGVILFIPEAGYSYTLLTGSLSHSGFKMDDLLYTDSTFRYTLYVAERYPEFKGEAEYFYLSSVIYARIKLEKCKGLDRKSLTYTRIDQVFRKNIKKIIWGRYFSKREKVNAFLVYTGLFRIVRKIIYLGHVSG